MDGPLPILPLLGKNTLVTPSTPALQMRKLRLRDWLARVHRVKRRQELGLILVSLRLCPPCIPVLFPGQRPRRPAGLLETERVSTLLPDETAKITHHWNLKLGLGQERSHLGHVYRPSVQGSNGNDEGVPDTDL